MENAWSDRKPNPKFPACAKVARRLLAEVYGCVPGDVIPDEIELLARAREVTGEGRPANNLAVLVDTKAELAVAMVEEIGGL
jgi:hypothetical protein